MRHQLFASLLLAILLATAVQAAPLGKYDLDSLAYLSSHVVEGDVVEAKPVGWSQQLTLKIDRSFGGDFKRGESISVLVSTIRKPVKLDPRTGASYGDFSAGDKL